jgi:endo-1,4-beta-xylanase
LGLAGAAFSTLVVSSSGRHLPVIAPSSSFKLAGVSSVAALCFCASSAFAQSTGGMAGAPSMGGASPGGASTVGGAGSGGAATGGAGGASAGASAGGASSGGAASGAAGMSAGGAVGMSTGGAPSGMAGSNTGASGASGMSTNLITNGTFDGTNDAPWWSNASSTTDNPADITLAITNGQLCGTMMGGGKNVWNVIIGYSGVALLPNQYYHIHFDVNVDTERTIKFKTGAGAAPYTDYFIEPVDVKALLGATPQSVDYTYLNLRNDPMAQFQFQIGYPPNGPVMAPAMGAGTVCIDNVVVEPVPTPTMPTYTTVAHTGHPFKDYKSLVKMGTAVDTQIFLSNPQHNAIVAGEFSMITPANSMKMNIIQPTQGVFDFTDTDALSAWAAQNGLEFRGHPLVWHTQVPDWVTSGMFDQADLTAIMYAHIDALMGRYKGKFPYWDVVNEAVDQVNGTWTYRSTVWHDTIGDDFMDLAFTHAHAADPSAILLYNDYNIEQKGNAKADYVYNMVADMKSRGIPINAVGFQGHYFIEPDGTTTNGVPDMQAIADNMARYNDIGIDVQITECDFRIGLPSTQMKTDVQTKFYSDLLKVCLDAPNCSHFTVWGLSDLDSWVPSTFPTYDFAHIFDKALMPKDSYFAMSSLFANYMPPAAGMAGAGGMSNGMGTGGMGGSATGKHSTPSSQKSSGGCSVTPGSNGTDASWLAGLGLLGFLFSRRRTKSAQATRS